MPVFCCHYPHDDLERLSQCDDLGDDRDTPVLRALTDARTDGYETICAPLANDKWRQRWRELCLLNPDEDQDKLAEIEQRAEAWRSKPAFFRDEVMVSRLGEEFCPSLVYRKVVLMRFALCAGR